MTLHTLSPAAYLALEQTSDQRHEYVDGILLEMPGESRIHNRIAGNIYRALIAPADAKNCEVAIENVKTRTQPTRYRYPDVVVSCDPGQDPYFLQNPCILVEVLSESTAGSDQDEKLSEYTRLPSLQSYIIVSQTTSRVVLYWRDSLGWRVETIENDGEVLVRPLDTQLMLAHIYAGVVFGA
jgi:Uma2 family endonuclease